MYTSGRAPPSIGMPMSSQRSSSTDRGGTQGSGREGLLGELGMKTHPGREELGKHDPLVPGCPCLIGQSLARGGIGLPVADRRLELDRRRLHAATITGRLEGFEPTGPRKASRARRWVSPRSGVNPPSPPSGHNRARSLGAALRPSCRHPTAPSATPTRAAAKALLRPHDQARETDVSPGKTKA